MNKRTANYQATKDDRRGEDEDDDVPQEAKLASEDILSKRKILKPRSRLTGSAKFSPQIDSKNTSVAADEDKPKANPFGSFASASQSLSSTSSIFGNGSSNSNSSTTESTKPNPFGKFKTSNSEVSSTTSNLYPVNSLSKFSSSTVTAPSSTSNEHSSIASQIKALNENFMQALTISSKKAPLGDYTDYCDKYIKYFKQIRDGSVSKSGPGALPAKISSIPKPSIAPVSDAQKAVEPASKPAIVAITEDSDDDSDDEKIEIKGPTFSFTQSTGTKSNSVFKFGAAAKKKKVTSDSDSEDEIEIKGPEFTLSNVTAKNTKVDTAFTWGKKAIVGEKKEEEKKEEAPKTGFTFDAKKTEEAPKTGFTFDAKKTEEAPKTGFAFGAKKTEEAPKTGFTFGAKKTEESPKTGFNFGTAKTEEAPKTGFTFGANKSEEAPKTGFNFGAMSSKPDTSAEKPAFSFGASAASSSSSEKTSDAPKPAFNFGTMKAAPASGDTNGNSKPAFSFSFASKPQSEPTETKENEDAAKPAAPAFSFTPSNTTGSTPSFSFGKTTTTDSVKPTAAFNFSNTANAKPAETPAKASLFGNSGATGGSIFGGANSGAPVFGNSNAGKFNFSFAKPAESKPTESKPVESSSSEPSDQPKPAASTEPNDEKFAGEENEEITYNKKAKLLQIEDGKYVTKGLGFLRILENKETKKFRLVLRSEGSNNVLLNTYVMKEVKYETAGKNTLKIPIFNDGKVEVYFIRVKSGPDLITAIDKCKESM
ncbi:hypothetical protein DASC09_002160 [Saccharomycopsis crataegensis]|uniref:RanBD1 domain-containing protein n=1 Tax=Saccharomycopsis crataegensis TaxID=43959 RepID=A0AAV5QE21_9ASCO|nr:hypothetical protein DASC09_002160 [Saccharomycopsis crataegensis]